MGKHDQSLKGGERGDSGRQGERRCISQRGKGGKQQGAGQARNKNRPLTLSAVTRRAASSRGERSVDAFAKESNPVSGLVLEFHPALVQQVASDSSFAIARLFF